jgi:signal transduction histidine kinase
VWFAARVIYGSPMGTSRAWWAITFRALPPLVVAVLCAVAQLVAAFALARLSGELHLMTAPTVVLLLAGPLCLLARRRYPIPALLATVAVTLTYFALQYPLGLVYLSVVVAVFNAVLWGPRMLAWCSCWACVAAIVIVLSLTNTGYQPGAGSIGAGAAWTLSILVVAEIVKARQEQAVQAEAARDEQARRLATEERLGIAREVHDVLAHHVSLINVQSGVALHLIDKQPEQAREALRTIKQSSKEVLVELRSILGVLRSVDQDNGPPTQPVSGLERLDALLERMRSAGLPVLVDVLGERRALPSGVDAAALRIVQESLTNTYRHAGPSQATVELGYLPGELRITVEDNGRGEASALSTEGSGAGLIGMRQRAEALGGTFAAAPLPGSGFRVAVTLPTGRDTDRTTSWGVARARSYVGGSGHGSALRSTRKRPMIARLQFWLGPWELRLVHLAPQTCMPAPAGESGGSGMVSQQGAGRRNLGLLSGVLFVVAWIVGTVLQDTKATGTFPRNTDSMDVVAEYFKTSSSSAELNAGLQIVSAIALLWFAGIMASFLRRESRPGPAAGIVLAGGAVAAATELLGAGAMASLTGSDLPSNAAATQVLYQLSFWAGGPTHVAALGMMFAAIAYGLGGVLPKWVNIFGLVVGIAGALASLTIVLPFTIMFTPIGRFLGFLWLLITVIMLAFRPSSTQAVAASRTTAPSASAV